MGPGDPGSELPEDTFEDDSIFGRGIAEGFVPGNKSGIEWTKKRYWSSVRSIFQQLWGKISLRNESKRIGGLGIGNWGLRI